MPDQRVVAVALLTQANLDALGPTLAHVWPVEEAPSFIELLRKIDEADLRLSKSTEEADLKD